MSTRWTTYYQTIPNFSKMVNEKDKTTAIEKTISKLLVRMKKDEVLDSTTFERIRPTDTTIPRLYGSP